MSKTFTLPVILSTELLASQAEELVAWHALSVAAHQVCVDDGLGATPRHQRKHQQLRQAGGRLVFDHMNETVIDRFGLKVLEKPWLPDAFVVNATIVRGISALPIKNRVWMGFFETLTDEPTHPIQQLTFPIPHLKGTLRTPLPYVRANQQQRFKRWFFTLRPEEFMAGAKKLSVDVVNPTTDVTALEWSTWRYAAQETMYEMLPRAAIASWMHRQT